MATSTTKTSIIAPEDVDLFTFRHFIDAEADDFAEEDAQKTIKEAEGKPRDKEYHETFWAGCCRSSNYSSLYIVTLVIKLLNKLNSVKLNFCKT